MVNGLKTRVTRLSNGKRIVFQHGPGTTGYTFKPRIIYLLKLSLSVRVQLRHFLIYKDAKILLPSDFW